MKIKYSESDGRVLEVESHPTHALIADDGEKIEEYAGPDRPFAGMYRTAKNAVREATPDEKDPDRAEKETKKTRLVQIKAKASPTLAEVIEALKIQGLL